MHVVARWIRAKLNGLFLTPGGRSSPVNSLDGGRLPLAHVFSIRVPRVRYALVARLAKKIRLHEEAAFGRALLFLDS
jgi:hypothetical protein